MTISGERSSRRQFVSRSAYLAGAVSLGTNTTVGKLIAEADPAFSALQERRRADLDDLQAVQAALRAKPPAIPIQYDNYK